MRQSLPVGAAVDLSALDAAIDVVPRVVAALDASDRAAAAVTERPDVGTLLVLVRDDHAGREILLDLRKLVAHLLLRAQGGAAYAETMPADL